MDKSQSHGVFADDYAALERRLRHYPQITILSTEKDPPEKYTIEYKLFGYGYSDKGKIEMRRRHRIQIELPFGYPHFPPTVKPLTAICHPDIDEHAVRIADQWQRNQSLADLVIHIADMIRGKTYSDEGTFNQEAAEWYRAKESKLPVAQLDYVMDPDKAEQRRRRFSVTALFRRFILTTGLLATLAVAAVYYHDMMYIRGAENAIRDGRQLMDQRQFEAARQGAELALAKLDKVLMLILDKEEQAARLSAFLNSRDLGEGLEGRVAHQGSYHTFAMADTLAEIGAKRTAASSLIAAGDLTGAVDEFEAAMLLAEENELAEELQKLQATSAEIRLRHALATANSNFQEERWRQAASSYGEVAAIIEKERRVLPDNSLSTLPTIKKLRLLAQVNDLKAEAVAAELEQKYRQAAENFRSIALKISRSGFGTDEVLAALQDEARRENARLRELVQVEEGEEYLTGNFKDIFIRHYPGLERERLQSPKVQFMGRSGASYVFILSCLELIQRKAMEYRLYYQFDPGTSQWSLYTEKTEEKNVIADGQ